MGNDFSEGYAWSASHMNNCVTISNRVWVALQSVLLLALVVAGPWFRLKEAEGFNLVVFIVAGGLFVLGAVVGIAGVRHLGRNRTPYPQPLAEARLVTAGVYAWVRHPLYASLIHAGLGWAGIWHSTPALVIALINVVFFDAKARCEERWLREKFPEYADYARRVKRFVPGFY